MAEHALTSTLPAADFLSELGSIVALMTQAPVQRRYPLAVLRSRLAPALRLNQYRIYRREGQPVAFVNWAWLSEEKSAEYRDDQCLLQPHEWQGGPHLWIMEIIAEQSVLPRLIADIRKLFPPGQVLHWHEVQVEGGSRYRQLQLPSSSADLNTALQKPSPG